MKQRFWIQYGATVLLAVVCTLLPAQNAPDPALLSRAQAGDVAAQVQVGQAYAAGKGVTQDGAQAAEWLGKAAG
jgi:TPR repeat protein